MSGRVPEHAGRALNQRATARMRIAIDVAVWRTRSIGVGLLLAALAGLAVAAVRRAPLAVVVALVVVVVVAMLLVLQRGAVVCRRASLVQQSLIRTLTLLSLPHSPGSNPLRVDVAECLSIRTRPIGGWSLLTFSPATAFREREEYLMHTLLKYQRTIRTIP